MKEKINVFDYSEQIMKALRRGILLNTNGDKFNSMVISWGALRYHLSKTRLMPAQKNTCLFTVRQVLPDTCNSDPTRSGSQSVW